MAVAGAATAALLNAGVYSALAAKIVFAIAYGMTAIAISAGVSVSDTAIIRRP